MTRDELVLNNQKLITYTLKSLGITYNFEEFYSIAQIGLVKASKYYDSSKGAFSTYAIRIIKNEIFYRTRKKQINTISLSTKINEDIELEDIIADSHSFVENVEIEDYIMSLLKKLSDRERDYIIKYYGLFGSERQNATQIAKRLGVTNEAISNVIRRAIKKLKKEVGAYE